MKRRGQPVASLSSTSVVLSDEMDRMARTEIFEGVDLILHFYRQFDYQLCSDMHCIFSNRSYTPAQHLKSHILKGPYWCTMSHCNQPHSQGPHTTKQIIDYHSEGNLS